MADLDHPIVQRLVLAAAWLLTFAMIGSCGAGVVCLVRSCGG